ncbi:MAG: 3-oxoacyl-[acyl-carrier-protein] synthase III C-terminal domain-containing protein [Polyangiaceae bacterium]
MVESSATGGASAPRSVGFLGFGGALPEAVRTNDDPVFERIRAAARGHEEGLFTGIVERRVLGPTESLNELTARAGERALSAAGVRPEAIDRLLGYVSVSEYVVPNGLFDVHRRLGLSARATVLPVDDCFTTFLTAAVLAWEATLAGRCQYTLITCGSDWTRHVDYGAPHSLAAGDGAGAAVVGPSERYRIIDFEQETASGEDDYHGMNMAVRRAPSGLDAPFLLDDRGLPVPTFEVNERGARGFLTSGLRATPRLVKALLARNGVSPERVAFVGHQGSRRYMDPWAEEIRPRQYVHTLERYGDLGIASIPVTLAECLGDIDTDYVVLGAPGPGAHFAALLVKR